MKVFTEMNLRSFEFWSGAKNRTKYLTMVELDKIQNILEDLYPDGISETEINDLFWFEDDLIAEWLGFKNFEEIIQNREELF